MIDTNEPCRIDTGTLAHRISEAQRNIRIAKARGSQHDIHRARRAYVRLLSTLLMDGRRANNKEPSHVNG